jgi:nucleotide-binding universal stress UspA family protein
MDATDGRPRGRIVVGVDGSQGALAALRWAVDDARRRGDDIEVVHAWHLPPMGAEPYSTATVGLDADVFHEMGHALIDEAISAAGDSTGINIERRVVMGEASNVILQAAEGADELVVGSRGHGALLGLLLGSVASQCARHATCPVVIVHPPVPESPTIGHEVA